MRFVPEKKSLLGENLESFESEILAADFPKYRAKQVFDWIFKKRISDWDSMRNLPKVFVEWLRTNYVIDPTKILLDKQ